MPIVLKSCWCLYEVPKYNKKMKKWRAYKQVSVMLVSTL